MSSETGRKRSALHRTETLAARCTPLEAGLIKAAAARRAVSVSQYMRARALAGTEELIREEASQADA